MASIKKKSVSCSVFQDFDIPHETKFVVFAVRKGDKWIFVKYKHKDTQEMPCGYLKMKENVYSAVCRELYEQTGVVAGKMYPVSAYSVTTGTSRSTSSGQRTTYGKLFYVNVLCQGANPHPKKGKTCELETLPETKQLTFPEIQSQLFAKANRWLAENSQIQSPGAVVPYWFEKVCGAVTFTLKDNVPMYVLIKNLSGHIGFPKGHVEEGETELQTVGREVYEETSLKPKIYEEFRHYFTYTAIEKQNRIHKTAVYYIAQFDQGKEAIKVQEEEILDWWLVPVEKALSLLNKDNDRELIKQAHRWITKKIIGD